MTEISFQMNKWLFSHCSAKRKGSSEFPTLDSKQEWLPGVEQESQKRDKPRTRGSNGKVPYVSQGKLYDLHKIRKELQSDPWSKLRCFWKPHFWHSLECFILSEESLGVCLDVPKLLSAQLTTCPAISFFLLLSGLSRTNVSQDPQSQLVTNKAGVVPIYCTLGKHRASSCRGECVAHITTSPSASPSTSQALAHWLCHKPPSSALHPKRGRLQ